ncbi:uncharacterized protein YegJ (DUF2314 family) [Mucilaginibacter sp. UYP25]|uniref:DUF2314 domain-containing protein n=1 Tax=unclassified Mucilaginibacter TaxID=2617802 RepID=UPI0033932B7E
MIKNWLKVSALALVLFSACKDRKADKVADNKVAVVDLKNDDKKIRAFKDTAQAKMNIFLDSLKPHALDSNYRFLVKSPFLDGKENEHMWSVVYKYADGKFTGIFADSAIYIKNVKMGDHVLINKNDVEDWAIYDYKHNTDMGNFSDKYMRSQQAK